MESFTSGSSVAATLSWIGLAVVCVTLFIWYTLYARRSFAQLLLSAIPLLLISLCLQSISSASAIFELFRHIASSKSTGTSVIYYFLIDIEQSFVWRVEELACAFVLVALFPVANLIRKSAPRPDAQSPPTSSGLIAIIVLLAISLAAGLVWITRDVSHILQLFIDPALSLERAKRFGQAPFGEFVTYLIRHLFLQMFVSVNLAFAFLCFGIKILRGNLRLRHDQWIACLLAFVFLAACGAGIITGDSSIRNMQEHIAKIEHDRSLADQPQ